MYVWFEKVIPFKINITNKYNKRMNLLQYKSTKLWKRIEIRNMVPFQPKKFYEVVYIYRNDDGRKSMHLAERWESISIGKI